MLYYIVNIYTVAKHRGQGIAVAHWRLMEDTKEWDVFNIV